MPEPHDPNSTNPSNTGTPAGIKVFQVIHAAFAFGIISFTLLTLFLGKAQLKPQSPTVSSTPPINNDNILLLALLALALSTFSIATFLWFTLAKQAGKAWDNRADDQAGAAAMLKLFGNRSIIVGALIDSVGLFAAVILFLTANPFAHIGIAASLLALALTFPTRQKLQDFVRLATEYTSKDIHAR
jgi:hypothetical protein